MCLKISVKGTLFLLKVTRKTAYEDRKKSQKGRFFQEKSYICAHKTPKQHHFKLK